MSNELVEIHIGIDDVDSISGGCTTHFVAEVLQDLKNKNVKFIDYPNLVRLNPAIPWKTRGNGAVAIRILASSENLAEDLLGLLVDKLDEYTEHFKDPKSQPGLVIHVGDVPQRYAWISEKALYDIVPLDVVLRVVSKECSTKTYFATGKRGIIGALAAVGYTMKSTDYTFELLAYRNSDHWGKPRLVDEESVRMIDNLFGDMLILSYDHEYRRVLITPRGPDPVLFGIRGETPEVLLRAAKFLRVNEPISYMVIFRTNQHTDSHIHSVPSICDIRPYMCVSVRGFVNTKPRRHIGGHVFFKLCDQNCCIDVATYEPAKHFRNVVEKLEVGDEVEVLGCVRPPGPTHGLTLNLEKMRILRLAEVVVYLNPLCPRCHSRMESAGHNKGFKCRRCGYKDPYARKQSFIVKRDLREGWYQPPRVVFKHLMKPIERFGREKRSFECAILDTTDFILESPPCNFGDPALEFGSA